MDIFELAFAKKLGGGSGSGGVTINNQDITVTENGTYTAENGYTGLGTVTVDVPTGGGVEWATGSFTLAEDLFLTEGNPSADNALPMMEIEHGLGFAPKYCILYMDPRDYSTGVENAIRLIHMVYKGNSNCYAYIAVHNAYGGKVSFVRETGVQCNPTTPWCTETSTSIPCHTLNTTNLAGGVTYYWIIGGR